jgi:hypothetical protein
MHSYVAAPMKAKDRTIPATPFSATWNKERNALKSEYHAQYKIGWENLAKGRSAQRWVQLMETHYANQCYKLKTRDGAPKFIGALWEHTPRVWKFRNSVYHADLTDE